MDRRPSNTIRSPHSSSPNKNENDRSPRAGSGHNSPTHKHSAKQICLCKNIDPQLLEDNDLNVCIKPLVSSLVQKNDPACNILHFKKDANNKQRYIQNIESPRITDHPDDGWEMKINMELAARQTEEIPSIRASTRLSKESEKFAKKSFSPPSPLMSEKSAEHNIEYEHKLKTTLKQINEGQILQAESRVHQREVIHGNFRSNKPECNCADCDYSRWKRQANMKQKTSRTPPSPHKPIYEETHMEKSMKESVKRNQSMVSVNSEPPMSIHAMNKDLLHDNNRLQSSPRRPVPKCSCNKKRSSDEHMLNMLPPDREVRLLDSPMHRGSLKNLPTSPERMNLPSNELFQSCRVPGKRDDDNLLNLSKKNEHVRMNDTGSPVKNAINPILKSPTRSNQTPLKSQPDGMPEEIAPTSPVNKRQADESPSREDLAKVPPETLYLPNQVDVMSPINSYNTKYGSPKVAVTYNRSVISGKATALNTVQNEIQMFPDRTDQAILREPSVDPIGREANQKSEVKHAYGIASPTYGSPRSRKQIRPQKMSAYGCHCGEDTKNSPKKDEPKKKAEVEKTQVAECKKEIVDKRFKEADEITTLEGDLSEKDFNTDKSLMSSPHQRSQNLMYDLKGNMERSSPLNRDLSTKMMAGGSEINRERTLQSMEIADSENPMSLHSVPEDQGVSPPRHKNEPSSVKAPISELSRALYSKRAGLDSPPSRKEKVNSRPASPLSKSSPVRSLRDAAACRKTPDLVKQNYDAIDSDLLKAEKEKSEEKQLQKVTNDTREKPNETENVTNVIGEVSPLEPLEEKTPDNREPTDQLVQPPRVLSEPSEDKSQTTHKSIKDMNNKDVPPAISPAENMKQAEELDDHSRSSEPTSLLTVKSLASFDGGHKEAESSDSIICNCFCVRPTDSKGQKKNKGQTENAYCQMSGGGTRDRGSVTYDDKIVQTNMNKQESSLHEWVCPPDTFGVAISEIKTDEFNQMNANQFEEPSGNNRLELTSEKSDIDKAISKADLNTGDNSSGYTNLSTECTNTFQGKYKETSFLIGYKLMWHRVSSVKLKSLRILLLEVFMPIFLLLLIGFILLISPVKNSPACHYQSVNLASMGFLTMLRSGLCSNEYKCNSHDVNPKFMLEGSLKWFEILKKIVGDMDDLNEILFDVIDANSTSTKTKKADKFKFLLRKIKQLPIFTSLDEWFCGYDENSNNIDFYRDALNKFLIEIHKGKSANLDKACDYAWPFTDDRIHNPGLLRLQKLLFSKIYYYPKTSFTSDVMSKVEEPFKNLHYAISNITAINLNRGYFVTGKFATLTSICKNKYLLVDKEFKGACSSYFHFVNGHGYNTLNRLLEVLLMFKTFFHRCKTYNPEIIGLKDNSKFEKHLLEEVNKGSGRLMAVIFENIPNRDTMTIDKALIKVTYRGSAGAIGDVANMRVFDLESNENSVKQFSNTKYLSSGLLDLQDLVEESLILTITKAKHLSKSNKENITLLRKGFLQPVQLKYFPTACHKKNNLHYILMNYFPFFFLLSQINLWRFISFFILEDKKSQKRHAYYLMGVSNFIYWSFLFILVFFLLVLLLTIYSVILFLTKICDHTEFSLVYVYLALYNVSTILFIFTLIVLQKCSSYVCFSILSLLFFQVVIKYFSYIIPTWLKMLLCFVPQYCCEFSWMYLQQKESVGEDLTWKNQLFYSEGRITLGIAMIFFTVSMFIYAVLIWYTDSGRFYRQHLSKMSRFYMPTKFTIKRNDSSRRMNKGDTRVFLEKILDEDPIEAAITDLTMYYGKECKPALDEINLKIYKGRITVIIGKPKAGKTTLLNILSGSLLQTSGKISINDLEVSTLMDPSCRNIVYCPSASFIMENLQVYKLLDLFTIVKSVEEKTLPVLKRKCFAELNLNSRDKVRVMDLSESQKIKLCIFITLMGDNKMILIDEPQFRPCFEVKKSIRNMILDLKSNQTVVLCTSDVEEAFSIADYIGVLVHGKLQVFGSIEFVRHNFSVEAIKEIINQDVPAEHLVCSIFQRFKRNILYLVDKRLRAFRRTFRGIKLNDRVRSKKTKPEEYNLIKSIQTMHGILLVLHQMKAICVRKFHNQMNNSFNMLFKVILPLTVMSLSCVIGGFGTKTAFFPIPINPWMILKSSGQQELRIFHTANPPNHSIFRNLRDPELWSGTRCHQTSAGTKFSPSFLDFCYDSIDRTNQTKINLDFILDSSSYHCECAYGYRHHCAPEILPPDPPKLKLRTGDYLELLDHYDISDFLIKTQNHKQSKRFAGFEFNVMENKQEFYEFRKLLLSKYQSIGSLLSATDNEEQIMSVIYNFILSNFPPTQFIRIHLNARMNLLAPAYLNYLRNSQLQHQLKETGTDWDFKFPKNKLRILATLHPLSFTKKDAGTYDYKTVLLNLIYTSLLAYALNLFTACQAYFMLLERLSEAKRVQVLTKLTLFRFWVMNLIVDVFYYNLFVLCMIPFLLINAYWDLMSYKNIGPILYLYFLHGPPCLLLLYLFTFRCREKRFTVLLNMNVFFGILPMIVIVTTYLFNINTSSNCICKYLDITFMAVSPHYIFCTGVFNLMKDSHHDQFSPVYTKRFSLNIYILLVQSVFFLIVLVLIECVPNLKKVPCVRKHLKSKWRTHHLLEDHFTPRMQDDVLQEQMRIHKQLSKEELIVLKNVTLLKWPVTHVINLGISRGECLGIVMDSTEDRGQLIRSLLGDDEICYGRISFPNSKNARTFRSFGYCSRLNTLFPSLTVTQTLKFHCRLKGVHTSNLKAIVDCLKSIAEVEREGDALCNELGFDKRWQLQLVISLIGIPKLVIVDLPDRKDNTKQQLFLKNQIPFLLALKSTVIIFASRKEEFVDLCSRIGIVERGHLVSIGSSDFILKKPQLRQESLVHLDDSVFQ